MSSFSASLIGSSGYAGAGFADVYDAYRPAPPAAVLDIVSLLAQAEIDAILEVAPRTPAAGETPIAPPE